MIAHDSLQGMLACPDELTTAERQHLELHLSQCPACRNTRALVEANRIQLQALVRPSIPPEVRKSVLAAAEASRESIPLYAAVTLPFFIIPVTLVAIGVAICYGLPAIVWLLLVLGGFAALTIWRVGRRESISVPPLLAGHEARLPRLAREVGQDVLGLVCGFGVLLLAVLAAEALSILAR